MAYGTMGGIGQGLQQIGGMFMDNYAREENEKSYMRKLEAAEKARDAREAADRARQAELEKTTPSGPPRVFLGDDSQGPPAIKREQMNKFGEVIGSGYASEGEASVYRSGLLGAADSRREKDAAAKWERDKFERVEGGKDRRAGMTDKRIRDTPRAGAAPKSLTFQKDAEGNILGIDPDTGEVKTKNGKPVGKSGGGTAKPFARGDDGNYVFQD